MQRLFIELSVQKDLCMYGGGVRILYAHTFAPEIMTRLTIGIVYFEWYKQ